MKPTELPVTVGQILDTAGIHPVRVEAFAGEQRHRSWRITTATEILWVKIEMSISPVSGLCREAACLRALGPNPLPRLIYARIQPTMLVTAECPGRPVADCGEASSWAAGAASALGTFWRRRREAPRFAHAPGPDLFGDRPDLGRLLVEAAVNAPPALATLSNSLARDVRPEPIGLVHGSYDPDNVLVEAGRLTGLVDLEAVRFGPLAWDVATMADGLLESQGFAAARTWLACAAAIGAAPTAIAGYLALRACYRTAAAPDRVDHTSLLELVDALR